MSQNQKKLKKIKKCVWAVDAFEDKGKNQSHLNRFLKEWTKHLGASIEPVYVLNSEGLNFPSETFSPMLKQFQPAAEKSLAQFLKGSPISKVTRPKVLVQDQPSITSSVKSLLNYSDRVKADVILVNTHARHGLPRLILGSFAESLLLNSKTPVLVMGPQIHDAHFEKILFPTDFAPGSLKVFKRVLALAHQLNSKLVIYHRETQPVQPILQSGVFLLGGGWVPFPEFLTQAEEEKRKHSLQWVKLGQSLGVSVECYFDGSTPDGIADSILGYAKRNKIGLIAMAAQSGAVAASLLGSITRKVVRKAQAGVLVIRR